MRIFLLPIIFLSLTALAADNAAVKTIWGYSGKIGPAHWGELDSDFAICSKGKLQSPIDIPKQVKSNNHKLTVHYEPSDLNIIEDGTTTLTIGKEQTVINDGHTIQLNFPAKDETINYDGKVYKLVQFHIHTPSENKWQGHSYPLEIHLVHQGKNGQLAVIGVAIQSGQFNTALEKITQHFPLTRGKEQIFNNEQLNPIELLPAKLDYYSFEGSLTTPPCSEGVQWLVMLNPITASPEQINALKKEININNARPIQSLNERDIYQSSHSAIK